MAENHFPTIVRITLVTPSSSARLNGNQVTARRWASIFKRLGHAVTMHTEYDGRPCDLLVALHARKSYDSIRRFRQLSPNLPLVVVLTGTDLYGDLPSSGEARRSLELATRLVALQERALEEIPPRLQRKTHVIYQSAKPLSRLPAPPRTHFRVCVVGHLRPEKDPFRTTLAARQLPADSRLKIVHVGCALTEDMEARSRAEMSRNPRYQWLGELPHGQTRRLLASSHLLVLTSRVEGSSNVLSEALVCSVPVLASRIPGIMGTLGEDYAGYFSVGDTRALAQLLYRAETDPEFYQRLKKQSQVAARLADPAREEAAWKKLLQEVELARA